MELLAYSHVRPAGRVVAQGGRLSLRLALSTTSVLRTGGASLATNPEAPDELDAQLCLDGAPADGSVACTASQGRWRFAVGNVPFDVEPARPAFVAPADWSRAMIEVAREGHAEWLAPPRIFPQAYLVTERSVDALPLVLARIDLDQHRGRLRSVWRSERVLHPRDVLGRVVVITDLSEGPLPASELQRRTGRFAGEAVVFRASAESIDERGDEERTGTLAFDGPRESEALPFAARPEVSTSHPSPPPVAPSVPPPAAAVVDRLTLGQRLAHRSSGSVGHPSSGEPNDAPLEVETLPRATPRVLWAAPDIARRVRMQPHLRELWPRVRRAEVADDPAAEERKLRELGLLLRDAPPTAPSRVALEEIDADPARGAALVAVRGWLTPELDEVAMLRALVAASVAVRREHAPIEESAGRAELMLAGGGLDDLPMLARDAGRRLLGTLRDVRPELEESVRAAAIAGLVRGRKYARRMLDGETFVRAIVTEDGEPRQAVAYLHESGAEKLPLMRRVAAVMLVTAGPPMEDGDAGPTLWIHALGRDPHG